MEDSLLGFLICSNVRIVKDQLITNVFFSIQIKINYIYFYNSYPIASVNIINPKIKLFEILGISENESIDQALFYLIVEKLEETGIEEEELSDEYTGWVDLGISLRYDINTSKVTKIRGLIKRRQTIIEQPENN